MLKHDVFNSELYDPVPINRKVMGTVIPWVATSVVERLYGSVPWSHWGTLPVSRTHIGEDGSMVVPSRIVNQFGLKGRWDQILKRMFLIPNGQVKNFLVACRTFWGRPDGGDVSVLFRGSKAQQGGGIWYLYYAIWVAMKNRRVHLNCYDYAEVPSLEEFEWCGRQIRIEHFAGPYDGLGKGYDAVIDDAYLPGSGIEQQPCYQSGFYSVKKYEGSFLHPNEGRFFSHSPQAGESHCPCMVCQICSDVSSSYDEYEFLRRVCTVLGHDSKCLTDSAQHEMVLKGETLRDILSHPTFVVKPGMVARAVISLAGEIPLRMVSGNVVALDSKSEVGTLKFVHTEGIVGAPTVEDRCTRLIGKKVLFVGVLPEILGVTPLSRNYRQEEGTYTKQGYDAMFASTVDSLQANIAAPVAFVPVEPELMPSEWQFSGFSWRGYNEYSYVPSLFSGAHLSSGDLRVANLPPKPQDLRSLSVLSHPVRRLTEEQWPTIVSASFHVCRIDGQFRSISSDFPVSHVYEDLPLDKCVHSPVSSPVLRTYIRRRGYYEGSESIVYDPGAVQCFVEIQDKIMRWDFIGPHNWSILVAGSKDRLRELSHTDGFVGYSYSKSGNYVSYVPPSWTQEEVRKATCSTRVERSMWGWECTVVPGSEGDSFLRELSELVGRDPLLTWFVDNGGWNVHFEFYPRQLGREVKGIRPWAKFFSRLCATPLAFKDDILRSFVLSEEGPVDRSIDLKLYDRIGKPRKKKRGQKS